MEDVYLRAFPLFLFVEQVKAGLQRHIRARHVKCQELQFKIVHLPLLCHLPLPSLFITLMCAVSKFSLGLKLKPLCTECLFGSRC